MNGPSTTAGLFIEESDDDENQDDDLKINNNHNNNNNNNNNQSSNISMNTQELMDDIDSKHESYDDEDDDDEEFPINDVITMLTISWRNEKLAPEILDYEHEYVDRVKKAIDDKEDELDDIEDKLRSEQSGNNNNKIISSSLYWHRKEIERIKYILYSYLRIRIWKIEKYILYILSDTVSYNRLSAAEQKFAASYSDLNENHFKNCFLRELPSKYQNITDPEMYVKPNLDKFVVIKSNENDDNVLIEGGKHHITLQKGNIFVARYNEFKHLVQNGTVDLI